MKAALFLALGVCSSVLAAQWSVEGSAGAHSTSIDGTVPEVSIAGTYDDFYFGLQAGGEEHIAFDAAWDHVGDSPFRASVGTSVSHHWGSGGLWTVYGDCGADLRFWDRLAIKLRGGVQFGLSWAEGSSFLPWSASPYIYYQLGYDDGTFDISAYGASMRRFEHTFQAPPVLGIQSGWNMDGRNRVSIDGWMKLADYMDGPDLLISDVSVRLTYTYRGGEA